jgi:DNA-binding transcriptional ArsR family regulator
MVIDEMLTALADPTRRRVVELLGEGPQRAGALAEAVGTTPPALSRHLRVLLDAGVIVDERPAHDARLRVFRLQRQSVATLRAWLDRLQAEWDGHLASFKRHLEEDKR